MKLDLTEIALNPGKRKDYIIDEHGLDQISNDIISKNPIKGKLNFSNTHGLIYVKGYFETIITLKCGRCLENYDFSIYEDIEEVLPVTGETEDENYLDDKDFPIFENYILNLTELLRQYILVEVPTQPLCNESCKGLCFGCGTNLNFSECKCEKVNQETSLGNLLKNIKLD